MALTPRFGPLNRALHIRETTWGGDPVTPAMILMPLLGRIGFRFTQPRERAVVHEGTLTSKGSYKRKKDSSGDRVMSMDYSYFGTDLMDVMGSTGYSRVLTLHKWNGFGLPLPYQIQEEFTQATALTHRHPGIIATNLRMAAAVEGQQQYTVGNLGKGKFATAAIAGSTVSDILERKGFNYFDCSILQGGVVLGNVTQFDFNIDRRVTGKDGIAQGGELAAYNVPVPDVRGTLGKIYSIEDGDTYLNQALNDTVVSIRYLMANKPLDAAPTKFARFMFDACLLTVMSPQSGGDEIPDHIQEFWAQLPDAGVYHPGHAIGTVAATSFNVIAGNRVVPVKFQGGATIDVNLTLGGARTMDQIVADLNADVTFAAAGTAYNIGSRLEIESKDLTVASSVQWQTATANSAHTLLGFTTTTWSGYAPAEAYVELFNTIPADYT